ncbi:MAG: FG-GAP repeat protein [Candidatus Sumerlaeia bacterium]|nr:FG-GAP repeat protein [Candidatus Sumerlaeia bacterium]
MGTRPHDGPFHDWILICCFLLATGLASANAPLSLAEVAEDSDNRGFLIHGVYYPPPQGPLGDRAGTAVVGAGDVDGDGLADLLLTATVLGEGRVGHLVFGRAGGQRVELSELRQDSDDRGFAIYGNISDRQRGVGALGDVNGDLLDDFVVGAPGHGTGYVYVLYGKSGGDSLRTSVLQHGATGDGFAIRGYRMSSNNSVNAQVGRSVSGVGDIDADNYPDVLVGTLSIDFSGILPPNWQFAVPISSPPHMLLDLECSRNDQALCVTTFEAAWSDFYGGSPMGVGDVNGDGIPDVVLSHTPRTDDDRYVRVVFTEPGNRRVSITPDFPNETADGFAVAGPNLETTAFAAGDVNGDGLADIVVVVPEASALKRAEAGQVFVVFGKPDQEPLDLDDIALDAHTGGFVIHGPFEGARAGYAVAGAGDVNGDGFADILVGTNTAIGSNTFVSDAYIVFGKPDGVAIDLVDIRNGSGPGIMLQGPGIYHSQSLAVSGAGDVNGDGLPDVIIGMPSLRTFSFCGGQGCVDDGRPGAAYVVFSPFTAPAQATYRAFSRAGFAPRTGVGILGDQTLTPPDARMWIGFDAGGAGEEADRASLETVTLFRTQQVPRTAGVAWHLETDRAGWGTAEVHLKYVDSEAIGLNEANLTLYHAPSLDGPWTPAATSLAMPERNRIVATLDESAFGASDWLVLSDHAYGPGDTPAAPADVNVDGAVTPLDAQWAFECFLGACPPGADLSAGDLCPPGGDGAITPSDVQAIFLHWLGVTPACE